MPSVDLTVALSPEDLEALSRQILDSLQDAVDPLSAVYNVEEVAQLLRVAPTAVYDLRRRHPQFFFAVGRSHGFRITARSLRALIRHLEEHHEAEVHRQESIVQRMRRSG